MDDAVIASGGSQRPGLNSDPRTGGAIGDQDAAPPLAGAADLIKALGSTAVPGTVVSARVVEALPDGRVLLAARGLTLLAEALAPLPKDTVVGLQVLATGDGLALRLLDPSSGDSVATSTAALRQEALGLPPGPAGARVLAAFEAEGAPLDGGRLRTAMQAALVVQQGAQNAAQMSSTGTTPGAWPDRLVQAHALLARAGLPVTPATVALAQRAADAAVPDAGAALRQALAAVNGAVDPRPVDAPGAAQRGDQQPFPGDRMPGDAASRNGLGPGPGPGGRASAPALAVPAAAPGAPAVTVAITGTPAAASPAGVAAGSSAPIGPAAQLTTAAGVPLAIATVPDPASDGVPAALRALALAGLRPAGDAGGALPASSSVSASAPSSAPPSAIPAPNLPLPAAPMPTLLQHLAALLDALPPAPPSTSGPGGGSAPQATLGGAADHAATAPSARQGSAEAPAAGHAHRAAAPAADMPDSVARPAEVAAAAVVRAVQEAAAEQVLPPRTLADYDRVLPLALQAQGQSTPARLAVARRSDGQGGNATWLRVDAELTRLGPVSIRMSGGDAGPVAITLVAEGQGAELLAAGLPDLIEDLRLQGIVAAVRVASPWEADRG